MVAPESRRLELPLRCFRVIMALVAASGPESLAARSHRGAPHPEPILPVLLLPGAKTTIPTTPRSPPNWGPPSTPKLVAQVGAEPAVAYEHLGAEVAGPAATVSEAESLIAERPRSLRRR